MLMSGLFGEDLFDEFMGLPARELANIDRQLYGKHAQNLMKTDVHENETDYEMDMDLPGFKKDQIKINLENGYLTIEASKEHDSEKKKHGKVIRQERYEGSMQRSFYVGENITEDEIKASFKHGVLNLTVPKEEKEKLPEKKQILIEG